MFASILSINVYFAYERHPEGVGPYPFRQKDRVAILLGKVLKLFIAFSLSDQYLLSTQKLVIAAILIPFFKKAFFNVLEGVALSIFSWKQAPDPTFFTLLCQRKVFVARIPNNDASSFQHTLFSSMACFVSWIGKACKPPLSMNLMIFCFRYHGAQAKFTEWIFVVNFTWNWYTLVSIK